MHNVETLARLALLGRGADLPVSRLLTVLTQTDRRVGEVPASTPLGEAVPDLSGGDPAAGGSPPDRSAVLLGGFGGQWARWADVAGLLVAEPSMREHGLSLGAGSSRPWARAAGWR